jgi:hypothetical protein
MSLFDKELTAGGAKDYLPSAGAVNGTIVALCDMGEEISPQSGKAQEKVGILFAIEETYDVDGVATTKGHAEKFTASKSEMGALMKRLCIPAEIEFDRIPDLLGKNATLFFKAKGEYMNLVPDLVEPSTDVVAVQGDLYVPRFWIEKNGEPTGFQIITLNDSVKTELRG